LVDLNASTSIHYYNVSHGPSKYIAGLLGDNTFKRTNTNYTWELAHELLFDDDANISSVAVALSNEETGSRSYYSYTIAKIKFIYSDGSELWASDQGADYRYTTLGFSNPQPAKLVSKVESWIYKNTSSSYRAAFCHGTIAIGHYPNQESHTYLTLNIPSQYSESDTHFRVKVDAVREGDDVIWFELVNEDNATKTYTNADFDTLLPIESPITKPTRLRIYMKPATSGATVGGTGVSAVYWQTNDPKSLWTGSNRMVKDIAYNEGLSSLKTRYTSLTPLTRNSTTSSDFTHSYNARVGFRLVRRP